MTAAHFVHYVICEMCGKQHRLVAGHHTVVGLRCCRIVWFPQGSLVHKFDLRGQP